MSSIKSKKIFCEISHIDIGKHHPSIVGVSLLEGRPCKEVKTSRKYLFLAIPADGLHVTVDHIADANIYPNPVIGDKLH